MKVLKSFFLMLAVLLILPVVAGASSADDAQADTDSLKHFFVVLSGETKAEEVEKLAEQYGLYSSYRNFGTGTYGYRIAAEKDIADVSVKANGSYAAITFYILKDDAVTEISYFNSDAMTEAFWHPDSGYSVIDYNLPQNVFTRETADGTVKNTCMMPAASAQEAVDYVSEGSPEGNLLAGLFLLAHEGMTEEEILSYVKDNGLVYAPNGPGNFKTIAYTQDVAEKYGRSGTVITFDTDDEGLLWMEYSYYPSHYRQGISAAFYSRSYAAFRKLDEGFLLCRIGSKPVQVKDPVRLIQLLHE